jgi:hypothetical protein
LLVSGFKLNLIAAIGIIIIFRIGVVTVIRRRRVRGVSIDESLNHLSLQLSFRRIFNCNILFEPGGGVIGGTPDFIFKAIFVNTIDVSDNYVLVAELIDSAAAALIVHLNLEVLVTVQFHEVVYLVSPLSICTVAFKNLEGPPWDRLHDFFTFLFAIWLLISLNAI